MQVLPTPESPISSSLNSRSYVFLAIFVSRTGSSKLIYERFQLKLQLLLLSLGLSHSHRGAGLPIILAILKFTRAGSKFFWIWFSIQFSGPFSLSVFDAHKVLRDHRFFQSEPRNSLPFSRIFARKTATYFFFTHRKHGCLNHHVRSSIETVSVRRIRDSPKGPSSINHHPIYLPIYEYRP